MGDGVVGQHSGKVAFSHAALRPVNDLRGEHGADAHFLTKTDEQRVDASRINVGELCQIANTHHHLGVGKTTAHVQIPPEAFGKPKADRLQHRVDPHWHAFACKPLHGVVEPGHCGWHIWHGHHFAAPVGCGGYIGRIDREHQTGTTAYGHRDLPWLKAVD